jgi:hypothetical protein
MWEVAAVMVGVWSAVAVVVWFGMRSARGRGRRRTFGLDGMPRERSGRWW